MNLNRHNFAERLPIVREAIAACDFYSIDMEFSGLTTASWRRPSPLDTLETRYQHARDSASSFMLLQLGVCCFKSSGEGGDGTTMEARAFNIDLAPAKGIFTLDASSVAFLTEHNFDFTRCFRDGVPYLQRARADARSARITAQDAEIVAAAAAAEATGGDLASTSNTRSMIKVQREEDRTFIETALKTIGDARVGWTAAAVTAEPSVAQVIQSVVLPPCNAFLRRVLYQEVEASFEDVELSKVEEQDGGRGKQGRGGAAALCAKWIPDVSERRAREVERARAKLAEAAAALAAELGVTLVVDALAASRKPLVGHNCLLDLAHLWQHFVAPLPPTVAEWADAMHARFPLLVDTKQLVSATGYDAAIQKLGFEPRSTGTALGDLFKFVTTTGDNEPTAKTMAPAASLPCEENAAVSAVAMATKAAHEKEVVRRAAPFAGVAPAFSVPTVEGFYRYGTISATCGSAGGASRGASAAEEVTAAAAATKKSDAHAHEAGFDAFMTGVVFARWVAALGQPVGVASSSALLGGASGAQPSWAGHVFNHLFLMRMRTTLRFPWHAPVAHNERGSVVHLRGLPRGTRADAIAAVFDRFCGRGGGKAGIYWVDSESLFLKFDQPHMAQHCLRTCRATAQSAARAREAAEAGRAGTCVLEPEEEGSRGLLEAVEVVSFAAYERRCAGLPEDGGAEKGRAVLSPWARYLALGTAVSDASADVDVRAGSTSRKRPVKKGGDSAVPAKRAKGD